MARRRQEVALQVEIESQEEWNDVISKEGLTGKPFKNQTESNFLFVFTKC